MTFLLWLTRRIDALTDQAAWLAQWAIFSSCFISAGNAVVRYSLNIGSNAWLEIQWYLFAAGVMLGAAQVLRLNEHVRVDVFYGRLKGRGKVLVDLFGIVFFLLPAMGVLLLYAGPMFLNYLASGETSSNAGGLVRWPVVLMLPLGFALVVLQGVAEVIKRLAWLAHRYDMDTHYERPLQ